MKTLLALVLGLGLLAVESTAKTTVAFLGIDPDTDPLFGRALTGLIRQDLEADKALISLPGRAVEDFLRKASLEKPEAGPAEIARLKLGLEADFYAFGRLENVTLENKRTWWTPWAVKSRWTRTLRLRVLDGKTGEVVLDSIVPGRVLEKHFMKAPDGDMSRKSAVERDQRYRSLLPFLSSETAKALSQVVTAAAPAAGAQEGSAPAEAAAAAPNPGAATPAQ